MGLERNIVLSAATLLTFVSGLDSQLEHVVTLHYVRSPEMTYQAQKITEENGSMMKITSMVPELHLSAEQRMALAFAKEIIIDCRCTSFGLDDVPARHVHDLRRIYRLCLCRSTASMPLAWWRTLRLCWPCDRCHLLWCQW